MHSKTFFSHWRLRRAWIRSSTAILSAGLVHCNAERAVLITEVDLAAGGGGPGAASGAGGTPGSSGPCAGHSACPFGMLCENAVCVPCPAPPFECPESCPFAFSQLVIERNGCTVCECVPPSECKADTDCQPWEICYPGVQCEEGCAEPACCFGNQCSQPGCPLAVLGVSCAVAGCHAGGQCLSNCANAVCECNGVGWDCSGEVDGAADAGLCVWACAAP